MDKAPVADRLLPGERLLWSGQPAQGVLLLTRDLLIVPFSVLWLAFAVGWEAAAWHARAPAFFRFFGVPFILAGLYLVAGRFAWLPLWYGRASRSV